ncbi:MAG: hypothetical protein WAK17_21185 [Candidatus Nitrosopolaris sp.]
MFSRVITAAINAPTMVPITIIEVKVVVELMFGRIATIIVTMAQKSLIWNKLKQGISIRSLIMTVSKIDTVYA